MLKEFHETPEVKAILASVNFTEHQRRNVLDNNSFTKSQRGNRFWPASVSRNNKEINVLDDDSLWNPRGENGFDSFMKSPRGIRFWPMFGKNTNNNDPAHEHTTVRTKKTFYLCLFLVPVFIHHFLSLNILFFVIFGVRVGKEVFEVLGSLRFLWRGSFLNPLGFGEREKF